VEGSFHLDDDELLGYGSGDSIALTPITSDEDSETELDFRLSTDWSHSNIIWDRTDKGMKLVEFLRSDAMLQWLLPCWVKYGSTNQKRKDEACFWMKSQEYMLRKRDLTLMHCYPSFQQFSPMKLWLLRPRIFWNDAEWQSLVIYGFSYTTVLHATSLFSVSVSVYSAHDCMMP